MAFTALDVKKLREMTNVGMMDCKKALEATDGDMDKAVDWLREKGLAKAAKKADRIAAEGVAYATVIGGVGVVIEVNSETDFAAKTDSFMDLVKNLAVIVAEQNPADVEALKGCKYPGTDLTVTEIMQEKVMSIGENMQIRRFNRFADNFSVAYVHAGGSRCICKFAYDLGIVGEEMTIETDAGIVPGWRLSDTRYRVKLTRPVDIDLEAKPGVAYGICGVPHAVMEVPGLTWDQKNALRDQAKALRFDPVFPKGANVDFYCWEGDETVRILSYERGVEDYTLACGTGCGALASILYTAGQLPGKTLNAINPGGTLRVTVEEQGGTD